MSDKSALENCEEAKNTLIQRITEVENCSEREIEAFGEMSLEELYDLFPEMRKRN